MLESVHRLMPDQGLIAHALARLLAASPDAGVRDGEHALRLASSVAAVAPTVRHLETLALAYAELGRCQEAAATQRRLLGAADEVEGLRADLARYEAGPPCRPPVAGGAGDGPPFDRRPR